MDAHALRRYGEQTRQLVARRGPLSVALFGGGIAVAAVLEYHYHPERLPYLLSSIILELGLCLAMMGLFRTRHLGHFAVGLTNIVCIGLLLCVTVYAGLTGADSTALALLFIVFELTTPLLFPWGARHQLPMALASGLIYSAYVIAGAHGADSALPLPYSIYAVSAGGVLSVLGAALLDRQRLTVFVHREQLDRQLATFRDLTETFHGFDPQRVLLLACTSVLQTFALRRLWAVWRAPSGDLQGYFASPKGDEVTLDVFRDPQRLWAALVSWNGSGEAVISSTRDPHVPVPLRTHRSGSVLFMPIRFEGENLGAIWADRDGEQFRLGNRNLTLASVLTSGVAIAMANARLYQQVTAASEEKSSFLARIAHELRNPLHTLLWDIDTLRKQKSGPAAILERLRQNGLMTLDVAKELQEFAEVETKQLTACSEQVEVANIFDDLRATAVALLDGRPIRFRVRVGAGAELLVTDPFRLRQILGNLLSNAAKFTERGTIELDAHRAGDEIAICVRDTGVGIAADDLPSIFTPFYRGSARPTTRTRGMGLGLAIAHELATLLGGRIEVESQVGAGSTFQLLIPAREVRPRKVRQGAPPFSILDITVLLVEDDERYRAGAADALRRQGARVVEASDGFDGLRQARRLHPDVIVLDVGLPQMGGVDVLSRLKRQPGLAGIPVVIATADTDARLEARCRATGCAAYLVKPHPFEDLVGAIAAAAASGRAGALGTAV